MTNDLTLLPPGFDIRQHSRPATSDPNNIGPYIVAIMNASNWILGNLPSNTPLFITIGEKHSKLRHTMIAEFVLVLLAKQRAANPEKTFAFGEESFHNQLKKILEHQGLSPSKSDLDDPDGQKLLAHYFNSATEIIPTYCAKTKTRILEICEQERIPTAFLDLNKVDVSILPPEQALSPDDTKTHDSVMGLISKLPLNGSEKAQLRDLFLNTGISATSSYGIIFRNYFMVEEALSLAAKNQVKICVISTGAGHVIGDFLDGDENKVWHPSTSQTAFFSHHKAVTLPITPSMGFENFDRSTRDEIDRTTLILRQEDNDEDFIYTELSSPNIKKLVKKEQEMRLKIMTATLPYLAEHGYRI